jgi:hypothetical protein
VVALAAVLRTSELAISVAGIGLAGQRSIDGCIVTLLMLVCNEFGNDKHVLASDSPEGFHKLDQFITKPIQVGDLTTVRNWL